MGNRDKARAAVYVMVGGYLIYLAYKLFSSRTGTEGSEATVMLAFAVFFLVIGVAILGLAFYMSRKSSSHNVEMKKEDTSVSKESEDIVDVGGK